MGHNVLITGAAGYVGRLATRAMAASADIDLVLATDIREVPAAERVDGVEYAVVDIRSGALAELLRERAIDAVVHLAAIVTPPPGATRDFLHEVEVEGTRNVLEACLAAGVTRFVYTSSGAAYGYWPDNAPLLDEDDALRGNEVFAYAHHKRLVEEMLAEWRANHPELTQVVFRVSTILGPSVHNQITEMFERPVVLGIRGIDTPFCFAWDEDVVACLVAGVTSEQPGTYNLTGDGVMTLREIAGGMGRRYVGIPGRLFARGLASLHRRELVPYGPEQLLFLRHRPVLGNARLKREFGYRPQKSTREVFELYRASRV